ncbi:TonB-dependent receptor domain-containing protein [Flavobacterium sp. C4GT6]|uniref:TonB-dependent receptor domain-containing protein n=1 Tax=Flavobacterium sp. C4GT6 TaxID=3103818 RepID=UPI002ED2C38F
MKKKNVYQYIKQVLLICLLFLSLPGFAQGKKVTLSGTVADSQGPIPYVNVIITTQKDNKVIGGTLSSETGVYTLKDIPSGKYNLEISSIGYAKSVTEVYVGTLSDYQDLGETMLQQESSTLNEVIIDKKQDAVSEKMDKKVFSVGDNVTQAGGSVLQAMQNLPGVTVNNGKLELRGNDKVMVLIDGKHTALTGFNSQYGLDNIPASAIDKIEIIENPSAKYDANGNAGIINIVYKKNKSEGLLGKAGLAGGYGALWERKSNLPDMTPQYSLTPKINPSLALNYRKEKINFYVQGDYLYTETLNKNEFVTRTYDDGTIVNQQTKRNRDTRFTTLKSGIDWEYNPNNTLSMSVMYGREKILDHGEEPFFNGDYSERLRFWKFLEDEVKTTVMGSVSYQHKFSQPGHILNAGLNYTFHREDEKYFFDNIMPDFTGTDAFKLLSDENVVDLNIDYTRPLKQGRLETGFKFRNRVIPTDMQFYPGTNSVIDADAGGKADYEETIPAVYGNYVYETEKIEAEAGVRLEYLDLEYEVNPNHPVYKTDGYHYFQPFPSLRFGYKINNNHKLSLFYNRRVDRPNEVDIRIFPKYDDAEIIKVGNPGLRPQYTNSVELGYKAHISGGYFFASLYSKFIDGTITRIATTVPENTIIYNVFENAGKSRMMGSEIILSKEITSWYTFNLNATLYQNTIDPFTANILYPSPTTYASEKQQVTSGNVKWNSMLKFKNNLSGQVSMVYLAPDIVPQGRTLSRFSIDAGLKKAIQKGRGELYVNATDLFGTLVIRKTVQGNGFSYSSNDYYETQVIRVGYNYKF